MFKKRRKYSVPALNSTSTSDISFVLLTFFLVTTSIGSENGLARRLPPPPQDVEHQQMAVRERNVLPVAISADGRVTCAGRVVGMDELRKMVETFVENRDDDPSLPERHVREIPLLGSCAVTDGHVVALEIDRQARYDTYFHVQEAIVSAYAALRDRLARSRFGHPLDECSAEEREAVSRYYPQRISETEPAGQEGGGL